MVRQFAQRELAPTAGERDRIPRFPREAFQRMAELGPLGLTVPAPSDSAGVDHTSNIQRLVIARALAGDGISRCFMIGRMWYGEAIGSANADAYTRHLSEVVVPELRRLAGFRGAHLLRGQDGDRIEIRVLTLWDSRAAIEAFTGRDISVAVVEPEARAVLADFDDFATHFDVTSFPLDE